MKELYKELGVDAETMAKYRMGRNFDKEKFKKQIIDFVKSESKSGKIPTYKEIQRTFHCLPKLYFPGGIREMAALAGISYARKFAAKTSEEKETIRCEVIEYTKRNLHKGYYPGDRDFRKDLRIAPLNYFSSIKEIYQKAGYNKPTKKTWKNSGGLT